MGARSDSTRRSRTYCPHSATTDSSMAWKLKFQIYENGRKIKIRGAEIVEISNSILQKVTLDFKI